MEQTKALNALAPFLALTRSATSPRAAADLITRATSHPSTFLFADLLASPSIQALSQSDSEEYCAHLALLEIFAHKTCRAYRDSPRPLPQLRPAQASKLRQLSLLTLAADRANLTYDALIAELALPPSSGLPESELTLSVRTLEDLVISAIYAGLFDASLDPRRRCVRISSVAPLRDLAPGAVGPMADALRAWDARCIAGLADIDARVLGIYTAALERERKKADLQGVIHKSYEAALKRAREKGSGDIGGQGGQGGGGGGGGGGHDLLRRRPGEKMTNWSVLGRGKRTMAMDGDDDTDDEAMDLDDDDDIGENKRNKIS